MKFCLQCGKSLDDHVKFCSGCGAAQPQTQFKPEPQPQPQYQPQPAPAANPGKVSDWDGGVGDTIINSIVASLIITFTCGIATPWAICYMMRFVVEHAVIDGKRMTFDGNGGDLFGQWIKWMLLTVVTCGIYSFWVVPRMYKWVCSHIHAK